MFDNTSGASLVDVVAASYAVPLVWPPVTIDGRVYMDGGIRSVANVDLAAGAEQVLILVPSVANSPLGTAIPDKQLQALSPARVHVTVADTASLEAMGANPLDPASRVPAAKAGRGKGDASQPRSTRSGTEQLGLSMRSHPLPLEARITARQHVCPRGGAAGSGPRHLSSLTKEPRTMTTFVDTPPHQAPAYNDDWMNEFLREFTASLDTKSE